MEWDPKYPWQSVTACAAGLGKQNQTSAAATAGLSQTPAAPPSLTSLCKGRGKIIQGGGGKVLFFIFLFFFIFIFLYILFFLIFFIFLIFIVNLQAHPRDGDMDGITSCSHSRGEFLLLQG